MGDIFITWDDNRNGFVNFVYNNIIAKNDAAHTTLHTFVNPSLKEHDRPNFAPWICEHECLTSARGATEASLIAYIMNNFINGGVNIREHDLNGNISLKNKLRKRKNIFLVQTKPGQHEELFSILANMKDFVSDYDLRLLLLHNESRDDGRSSAFHTRDHIVAGQRLSFAESTNPSLYYEETRSKEKPKWKGNVRNGNEFGPGRRSEHQNGQAPGRFRTTSSNITAYRVFQTTSNDSTPHRLPPHRQHDNKYPMLYESVCENCRKRHGNGRYEGDLLESAKLRRSWPSTGHGRQRQVEVMHICEICMSRYYHEDEQITSKWPARPRTPLTMESKDNMNEQCLDHFEQYCPSCATVARVDNEFEDGRSQANKVKNPPEPKELKFLQNGSVKCSCLESDSPFICSDCFVKKIIGRSDADDAKAKTQNRVKEENENVNGKIGMLRKERIGTAPAKLRSNQNDSNRKTEIANLIFLKQKDKEGESFLEQITTEDIPTGVKETFSLDNGGGREARTECRQEGLISRGSLTEGSGNYETWTVRSRKQSFNDNNAENQEFLFRERSNSEENTKIGFEKGREDDEGRTGTSDNTGAEHEGGLNVNEANEIESQGSFNTTLDDLLAKLGSKGSTQDELSDEAQTGNYDQQDPDEHQKVSIATPTMQERTQNPEINADMMGVSLNDNEQKSIVDFANMFPLTDKQKFLHALEAPLSSSVSPIGENESKAPSLPKLELISTDGFGKNPSSSESKENNEGYLKLYNYDIFNELDNDTKIVQSLTLRSQSRKKPSKRNALQTTNGKHFCQFCPDKEFSSKSVWRIHMKNCHKKCNCPCGEYFDKREDYLLHFYQLFPLACFVERKCPERFRSLYFQAVHHRDRHNSSRPFYCVLCFADLENSESRKRACFKDIKSLRIHAEGMGHNPNEMFLISSATEMDSSMLPWSMTCTGIDFC